MSAANRPATPGYVVAYQWDGANWDYIDDASINRTTKTYSLSLPPGDNYLLCAAAADAPSSAPTAAGATRSARRVPASSPCPTAAR